MAAHPVPGELKPFRQEQAASLMKSGALIAYERNGGPECIDELFGIFPDGKIVGDDGVTTAQAARGRIVGVHLQGHIPFAVPQIVTFAASLAHTSGRVLPSTR